MGFPPVKQPLAFEAEALALRCLGKRRQEKEMQDNVLPEDPVSAEERANKLAAKESGGGCSGGGRLLKFNVCWDAAVCAVSAGGFFSVGMAFRMRTSADPS